MKFADSFSYLPSNQSIYCFDLGGNVVLRIETIYSPNARIYFTDTNNPPNNIEIPPGIVVRDTTRNLILPRACFQPLGYYLILWYYSYEITYNNQVVIVLSNQEQQSVQLADGLVHYLDWCLFSCASSIVRQFPFYYLLVLIYPLQPFICCGFYITYCINDNVQTCIICFIA